MMATVSHVTSSSGLRKFQADEFLLDNVYNKKKGKAVPLQARGAPESFTKLRFPDYVTMAQNGGKVVKSGW
jgi:hypothetical protein